MRGDPAGEPFNKVSKIVLQMIFSIMLGLLSFFIIIAISTWYISKSILHPLQELNMAAENIAQGNLDYEIKYGGSDELGRFCQTFDLMRSKLKNSLEKQYAYEKSRQEMIASISHDLRTPISSVKGYVEGLLDGVVKNEDMFKRYLSVIKDKTEQLDRLIDDLSQFSNLELAKIQINPIQWECKDLFSSILGQYLLEFEDSNIDFRVDGDIPAGKIMADKHRLKQVFDNLIGNAKKYTGQQGVINCKIKQQENRILVAIADNGIGISNEDLPHIFDVFYRGEKSRSREYGGTGLGLAISKYIINAHGGEIWVESIQNKGSVFYFSLPLM